MPNSCLLFIFLIFTPLISCKEQIQDNKLLLSDEAIKATETSFSLKDLSVTEGKYPEQAGLFAHKKFEDRLFTLMGKDFNLMKSSWNTETPFFIEDNVLWTTGCEKHNCSGHQYILLLDLEDDNINVFRFKDGQSKSYEEKGIIGMPAEHLKRFELLRKTLQ